MIASLCSSGCGGWRLERELECSVGVVGEEKSSRMKREKEMSSLESTLYTSSPDLYGPRDS